MGSGLRSVLVANRGEIAVRLLRAVSEYGARGVAVYAEDDAEALPVRQAVAAHPLTGAGPAAYLDGGQIVRAAQSQGCDAIHPGYGFLSESAAFARMCQEHGVTFVGPRPEILELFGDKVRARLAAAAAGVPVLPGLDRPATVDAVQAFFRSLPAGEAMIIKAVAGGGGRGVRVITREEEIAEAYTRCRSEAQAAFGNGDLYAEQLVRAARHVEVQVIGDGSGAVSHLGERDCTLQRRHQKLIEVAPAPGLPAGLRQRILQAATTLAAAVRFDNAGTIEFLVDAAQLGDDAPFYFIEANPRLQVEHTVTEQVTGLDLARIQLELAAGGTLAALGLTQELIPAARGCAIQARVNMETMTPSGAALPAGGTLTLFAPPAGPGVRVDTFGYTGYRTSPRYDSLLAKVIATSSRPGLAEAADRARRALAEFGIEGLATNVPFLHAILSHPDFLAGQLTTGFIDDHLGDLLAHALPAGIHQAATAAPATALAGVKVDAVDPLAVLAYGQAESSSRRTSTPSAAATAQDGALVVAAPLQGTVVAVEVRPGEQVRTGQLLAVMEAMKMEHEIRASSGGTVLRVAVAPGDTLWAGHALLYLEAIDTGVEAGSGEAQVDLDAIRPDLAEVLARHERTLDAARPEAVARRRRTGQRTVRENVDDLVDPGTFVEYGPLVVANQRSRRTMEELIVKSPADGLITGVGSINGQQFPDPANRCAVMAYDYTVFAGTQGGQNHRKTDRIIDIAEQGRMPFVLFAEGGGGRPGDDSSGAVGSGQRTFSRFAQLSALVPVVGITSGRCFAGNASLLGCCDVIIATEGSNIGMGGPAMIEGGGLGVFAPEDIGPLEVQLPNGVVDLLVRDEAEAVRAAKQYLSYFQGPLTTWQAEDQRRMRVIIPENRLRVYQVRDVISTLADTGTVMELRRDFGPGMVTALARIEGRPIGIIANNPTHLGGAIDSDGADKAARFMQLCDAFDIPLLHLCDTPGIMVGPEIEKTALVRHSSRMFLVGANLSVPFFTIVLRKAYGLGAIAMAGGSYKVPAFTVSWPTGEFWGMGIEGSVKLGFREELTRITDPAERKAEFDRRVARAYEASKAINNATGFGIDDTIDPADSRRWLASLLRSIRPPAPRAEKKRPMIDAW